MNASTLMPYAIAGGILFVAYKYGNGLVKGGAVAVAATIVAGQIPYLKDVMA